MQSLSPPTRRILASGLLVLLLLLGASLAGKLAGSVGDALQDLEDRRFRVARLSALAQRPAPPPGQPVPTGMAFQVGSREAAEAELAAAVAAGAENAQVTLDGVSALPADPMKPSLVRLSLGASGPEPALLSFINQVEQHRPAIRLSNWKMRLDGDGATLRLEAVALAAWQRGR